MAELRLREHALHPDPVALGPEELDALLAAVPSLSATPSRGRPGCYDLQAGSEVGALEIGELRMEIRPKVDVARVLFLLAYSASPGTWRREAAWFEHQDDMVEAVIPGFLRLVGRVVRSGLLQGYRRREESLDGIRGRVRFGDQVRRRCGRFPPAEVTYDDFTVDVDENRVLKAALLRLGRLRIRSRRARRALRAAIEGFAGVSEVRYTASTLPAIRFTRLNQRYVPAIELARRILEATSFGLGAAQLRAHGFLVDMNALFEDFVVTALREALGASERSFPQGCRSRKLFLDVERRVRLEPDVSWWRGSVCRFVGDVKYKRDTGRRGLSPDLYQLLAYVVAADLPSGILIYAQGDGPAGVHRVRHLDRELEVTALDLSLPPEELLEQVAALAERIRGMAGKDDRLRQRHFTALEEP